MVFLIVLQSVQWTFYVFDGFFAHMRVPQGCFEVIVPEQFLNKTDIGSSLYQMRRKTVS